MIEPFWPNEDTVVHKLILKVLKKKEKKNKEALEVKVSALHSRF